MSSVTIQLQRIIDSCIFSPLCVISSIAKSRKLPEKSRIKNILVVKFWAVGDSINLLPTIYALKKEFPHANVDVLAHPRNRFVFEQQPFIHKIIDFSAVTILKTFRKYDLCIDAEPALSVSAVIGSVASPYVIGFNHGIRRYAYSATTPFSKNQHMVQNYLDLARKAGVSYTTKKLISMHVPHDAKKAVASFLKEQGITTSDFVVGISPGVAESVKFRMWPLKKVAAFADTLVKKHKAKIVFIDIAPNESAVADVQAMMKEKSVDATNLKGMQLTAIVEACDIFVGNDSGFMHTAAAQGIKTIGLFGPNTPTLWGPYGQGNIAVFKPKAGCPYMDNTSKHLLPRHLTHEQLTVMDNIQVEDVVKAVEKLKKAK